MSGIKLLSCFLANSLQKGKSQVLFKNVKLFSYVNHSYSTSVSDTKEVYYGALTPQIRGVKVFSLTTSAVGVIAQPILYHQVTTFGGGMPLTIALGSFIGFFTFITPFLLHTISKKYVTRIRYNPKEGTYIATTLTFFLRQNDITFRPEDVEVPDIPGMFTTFHIKGRPVFVDPRMFPDIQHYAKIMGFDKPMDFKLGELQDDSKPNKT